jgi:hypothetical protein
MFRFLKQMLTFHWTVTILLMGVFGLLFGLVSLNIISLLHTNFSLIAKHGAMALMDGALTQLLQLLGYGILSLIFWILFKACEHVLVNKLTH